MNKRKLRRVWRALVIAAAAPALLLLGYFLWEEPPATQAEVPTVYQAVKSGAEEPEPSAAAGPRPDALRSGETEAAEPAVPGRKPGVYTLLLAGSDDGNGNTDTILLGRIDTRRHRMDFVSIPRDTLVNLDWSVRKINAVYAGTANSGGVAIDGLRREIRKLCGFAPDCCAVVDLGVFVEAVDLVGGIEFEVPKDMHYDDAAQELHIHLDAGPQRLSGEQAMGLVRYRSGYVTGDLGRVEMQQRFLKAALGQLIRLGTVPRLPELVSLVAERTDTDLSAANVAWFIRQALLCDSEDIRFSVMPNTPATVHGLSYALVDPEPWLAMVNESLSPFTEPVTEKNVDLVVRDGGGFRATGGELLGPGYYDD